MGVTVTLVFADEAHREMWLKQQALVPGPSGDLAPGLSASRNEARIRDYETRRSHQNLTYVVGALED